MVIPKFCENELAKLSNLFLGIKSLISFFFFE